MLGNQSRPACLSFISTDLPILTTLETAATFYQQNGDRFHILLTQPELPQSVVQTETSQQPTQPQTASKGLLWLEISPYRAILTMQGNGHLAYRHYWEPGVYGISRYWLNSYQGQEKGVLRLRNFTRSLQLEGSSLPQRLRVDYELWSDRLSLGHYVLHLEISL